MQALHSQLPRNFFLKANHKFQEFIRKEIIDFDPYEEKIIRMDQFLMNDHWVQAKTSPSRRKHSVAS